MDKIIRKSADKIKEKSVKSFTNNYTFTNNDDQYISLTSMIFYNYFENISDKFKLIIKNKTQSHTVNFKNVSYYSSDISKIIKDIIKTDFNISEKESPNKIGIDVNRYAILIAIKKDWKLELDKNFMNLFGFEKKTFLKKEFIDLLKRLM